MNLGNPSEISILELAETILRLTGSDSPLEFRPAPQDDPTTRQPDIGKADGPSRLGPDRYPHRRPHADHRLAADIGHLVGLTARAAVTASSRLSAEPGANAWFR